jgi:hypothetical protein
VGPGIVGDAMGWLAGYSGCQSAEVKEGAAPYGKKAGEWVKHIRLVGFLFCISI